MRMFRIKLLQLLLLPDEGLWNGLEYPPGMESWNPDQILD
jgi:hypothetical protein